MSRRKKHKNKNTELLLIVIILLGLLVNGIYENFKPKPITPINQNYTFDTIPAFNNEDYIILNDNKTNFKEEDYKDRQSYEFYSELDELKRCGYAIALIGKDLMPTKERGSIGMIKPSGWQTIKYDFVDGKYLYNRCHLIGYQLTGENANVKNLITCTRSTNTKRMLPFENKVAEYIKSTNNHVLYRVTPIFKDDELVARGIRIEAKSMEDNELEFNVFIHNVEENIDINYKTGESSLQIK